MTTNNSINAPITPASSWTPVLRFGGASTGITYSSQTGSYYKIGNLVCFSCQFVLTSKGSATGAATISGLPVSAAQVVTGPVLYQGVDVTGNSIQWSLTTNIISLISLTTGTNASAVDDVDFDNTSEINLSGTFLV